MRRRTSEVNPTLDAKRHTSTVTRRTWAMTMFILIFGAGLATGYGAERSSGPSDVAPAHRLSTFVIEREIPGAGKWSPEELRDISRKSREVLEKLGPDIHWVQSYVVDNKVYCIYEAPNQELIRRHAKEAGFPANRISEVRNIISLQTAE